MPSADHLVKLGESLEPNPVRPAILGVAAVRDNEVGSGVPGVRDFDATSEFPELLGHCCDAGNDWNSPGRGSPARRLLFRLVVAHHVADAVVMSFRKALL